MKIESVAKLERTDTFCRIYIETTVDGMKLQDVTVMSVSGSGYRGALLEDYFNGVISLGECIKFLRRC